MGAFDATMHDGRASIPIPLNPCPSIGDFSPSSTGKPPKTTRNFRSFYFAAGSVHQFARRLSAPGGMPTRRRTVSDVTLLRR